MKKMVGRQGQTMEQLVPVILGLFVIVAVGLLVYYFMQSAEDVTDNMIKKAEVIAQSCSVVASPSLASSFCLQLREINNKNFVTCDSLAFGKDKEKYGVVIKDVESMKGVCVEFKDQLKAVAKAKCEELKSSDVKVVIAEKGCNILNPEEAVAESPPLIKSGDGCMEDEDCESKICNDYVCA